MGFSQPFLPQTQKLEREGGGGGMNYKFRVSSRRLELHCKTNMVLQMDLR